MKEGLKYVIFKTKWGFFGLLANQKGLLRSVLPHNSYMATKKYLLVGMFRDAKEHKELYPELQKAIKAYYDSDNNDYTDFAERFSVPLCLKGSQFAQKILKTCMKVRPGRTITYSQLAKNAGFTRASRAAGSVLAKNQFPLIIPCHRVIRSDGKIGNFSAPGGTKTKTKMLEYEIAFGID
ncbi:MAG: MGMT family protein [Phycisphaerae bacterium]|nr:MGMT family protein [Phycisphaerae bacterium]